MQQMEESSKFGWLDELLSAQEGNVSCVYLNLKSGETYEYQKDMVHPSASVIKIFLMAYIYQLIEEGAIKEEDRIAIKPETLAESSGVLYYLKDVHELSVRDLMELMIIVSDNTATNVLLGLAGMESLQLYISEVLGYQHTLFQRRMMDFDAVKRGFQNYTTAEETADFLKKLYLGKVVSPEASGKMMQILREQQFSDLIPYHLYGFLPEQSIAHKAGGLDHVVHDAGIVLGGDAPFVLCMFGSEVDVPSYSRVIQDVSLKLYELTQER